MLETSPAPEILSANAVKSDRRRKYLSADSICWMIYDRQFWKENSPYTVNFSAEDMRQQLCKVSTRLLDLTSDLCCICRCVDFEYFYSGFSSAKSLIISGVIPLGLAQDMDSDCSLCQLMVHSSNRNPGMACFLCFRLRTSGRPRLGLSLYELTSSLEPKEEMFNSYHAVEGASEPHEVIRCVRNIPLVKIGDDSTWALRRKYLANGRVVAPTVNFCRLRKFLEATDPVNSLNFWKRRLFTSNLTSLIPMLADLPRLFGSAKHDPRTIIPEPKYSAPDDYNMRWELPARFRLVDVHWCCLVNPTLGVRFVALSYIWGKLTRSHLVNTKANFSNLYLPKAINPSSEALPRTIRDAMLATASLGYRYLWVDALCIVQDDHEDKQDQMNRMAAIYRLASFTIVAAVGDDADAGLLGVGLTRRPQWQYVFGNGSARFANSGGDLEESMRSSHWFTRGWTYQEYALSSRLLIFTTQQAFTVDAQHGQSLDSSYIFQCESNTSRSRQRGGLAVSFSGHITSKPLDALGLYNNAVQTYSRRDLTFQGDIMNAFEGIAGYLNQGFRGGFTFGLPNTFLELGLMWFAYSQNGREPGFRKGFPEYSWASRCHRVSMWGRLHPTWPSSRIVWRNFSPQRKNDWICEDDIMPQVGSEEATKWIFVPEGSKVKVVSSAKPLSITQPYWEDTEEHPSWQHARPILQTRLLPSFQPAEPGTGHLHFWSHVIRIVLDPSSEDLRWVAQSGQSNQENGVSYSNTVGEFKMDSHAFPNPIDLILLCCFERHNRLPYFEPPASPLHQEGERHLPWHVSKFVQDAARADRRQQTVEDALYRPDFTYAVLAVETIDGISYRRGVGMVDLSYFHKADPKARLMILG